MKFETERKTLLKLNKLYQAKVNEIKKRLVNEKKASQEKEIALQKLRNMYEFPLMETSGDTIEQQWIFERHLREYDQSQLFEVLNSP